MHRKDRRRAAQICSWSSGSEDLYSARSSRQFTSQASGPGLSALCTGCTWLPCLLSFNYPSLGP